MKRFWVFRGGLALNKQRWLFVTAPFILFTIYTFVVSSSFPDAPVRMRWLVAVFLGFASLLLVVQRASNDENYFIPTMVMVLLVNLLVIFSVGIHRFDKPESMLRVVGLLLQRPQLILYFGLMMMALVPPLAWRSSFTSYFSRIDYPEEDWGNPDFIRVNRNISFFWVPVFLLCFLTQLVPILIVQLLAPILIVASLGAWGTRMLIDRFIDEEHAEQTGSTTWRTK